MQDNATPVLILAQSGRYLAQSASLTGHTVWLADCFCDEDSLAVAARWLKLPACSELSIPDLLEQLICFVGGDKCMLICGSGIEIFSPLLSQLPKNITYIGNTIDTIGKIKNPQQFFSLLSQHNLPYPITSFIPPKTDKNWLFKKELGFGGSHIIPLDHRSSDKDGYFQHCIIGESGSVLFFPMARIHSLFQSTNRLFAIIKLHPFSLRLLKHHLPFHQKTSSYYKQPSISLARKPIYVG